MHSVISSIAVALMIVIGASSVNAQALQPQTVEELKRHVAELRESLDRANQTITANAPLVKEQEQLIADAPKIAEQLILDLQALAVQFEVGSDIHNGLQSAKKDIGIHIDRFREGSEVQKRAAETLRATLKQFEQIDTDRDRLVGEAQAEIRRLTSHKDDIEATIIAGAYTDLAKIYQGMLDGFQGAVTHARNLGNNLAKTAGIDQLPQP